MKKIKLPIFQLLGLEEELNGTIEIVPNKKSYKGFLNHKLPLFLKFNLMDLSEELKKIKNKVTIIRNVLIEKYGTIDENTGDISLLVSEDNNNFKLFEEEFNLFITQEIEINYYEITIEDLKKCEDTTDNYETLFLLIKKP